MRSITSALLLLPTALAAAVFNPSLRSQKHQTCLVKWTAGTFGVGPQQSDDMAWLVLQSSNVPYPASPVSYAYFYFQPSNGLVWANSPDGGSAYLAPQPNRQPPLEPDDCTQNACELGFGDDGDLVYYFKGNAIGSSGTAGKGVSCRRMVSRRFWKFSAAMALQYGGATRPEWVHRLE